MTTIRLSDANNKRFITRRLYSIILNPKKNLPMKHNT